MQHTLVRYRVKPEHADENERLVRDVFVELASADLEGLRYSTYLMQDGVTFLHLVSHVDPASPLLQLAAFQRFAAGIGDRCEEQPTVSAVRPVGLYAKSDLGPEE